MAAKMKGLDKPLTVKSSSSSSSSAAGAGAVRPHKDVNTFVNNQLKFSTSPGLNSIPPDQMKCNILKAVTEEQRAKQRTDTRLHHLLFHSLLHSTLYCVSPPGKYFIPLSLSTYLNSSLTIFHPDPCVLPIQISLPDQPVLLATFPLGHFLCLHLLLGTLYLHTFVPSTPYPPSNAN